MFGIVPIGKESRTIVNTLAAGGGFMADASGNVPTEYRTLAARLQAAEGKVFPLVMVDPDRYERAVTVVGLLARHLDERSASFADLVDGHDHARAIARELASGNGVVIADLDVDVLVEAAMAQRLRTLLVEQSRSRVDDVIEAGRSAGLRWVTISEPDGAGMAYAQTWVEAHVATGAHLVRSITMNPDTGAAVFTVSVIDDGAGIVEMTCTDREQWLREADRLRAAADDPRTG